MLELLNSLMFLPEESELQKKILDENRRVHALENRFYLKRHLEQTNRWQTRLLKRTLDDYCSQLNKPKAKILDVGCGTGYLYIPLLVRGYDMTGLDLSEEMVEVLRGIVPHELRDRSRLIVQDVMAFSKQDTAVFDGVVLSALLHHLYDFESAIVKICQKIKPGGLCLIFFEPLKQDVEVPIRYRFHKWLARLDEAIYLTEMGFRKIAIMDSEYKYADYQRQFGGIDPDHLGEIMKQQGMKILSLKKYCARRYGFAAWTANNILKTTNTFNLLAQKSLPIKEDKHL